MTVSDLTLISHPLCPFVQRAAIVLNEKGVPFERINIDLANKPDWFLAISPLGKVPLLKVRRHDGQEAVIFESMVVCEYLEETVGGGRLYPEDALARAQQRSMIEFATALLSDAWGYLNARDSDIAAQKWKVLRGKLHRFEAEVQAESYFAGEEFTMVDAVMAPVLRYFDILGNTVENGLFEGLPRVVRWRERLGARPSVQNAVSADYGDLLLAHLHKHGSHLGPLLPNTGTGTELKQTEGRR